MCGRDHVLDGRRRRINRSRRACSRVVASVVRRGSRPGFKRGPLFPKKTGRFKWEHRWEESCWWARLQTAAAEGNPHALMPRTVERKLRLPWSVFDALAREMEADPDLQENATRAVPLRLKLCAAIRYLATGHSFDSLEESFRMSAQTMRRFFWGKFLLPWMMARKYETELQLVIRDVKCCATVDTAIGVINNALRRRVTSTCAIVIESVGCVNDITHICMASNCREETGEFHQPRIPRVSPVTPVDDSLAHCAPSRPVASSTSRLTFTDLTGAQQEKKTD